MGKWDDSDSRRSAITINAIYILIIANTSVENDCCVGNKTIYTLKYAKGNKKVCEKEFLSLLNNILI